MTRILIVEDDMMLGDGLSSGLRSLGFETTWCRSGEEADLRLQEHGFDAVILDLGLAGADGMHWLEWWRENGQRVPILVLTARDALPSRVRGLNAGADDYLIKPIALEELTARLRAVIRRTGIDREDVVWKHGDVAYSPSSRTASLKGQPVVLTPREALLLEVLLANPNRLMTREQILGHLSGCDGEIGSDTLEVLVYRLRRKFFVELIRTVRGVGYALGHPDVAQA